MKRALARVAALACVAALASTTVTLPALAQSGPPAVPHVPQLTKAPKLVKFVEAPYPEAEKAAGRTASVTLEIAVAASGLVDTARVMVSAGPVFDAAALDAVKQFVFEPAEVDNNPAPVKLTYRYDFVFKEEPKGPVLNVEGKVFDRFTKKPLPGVTITIEGLPPVTTDADGHFAFFDVPTGKHPVTIAGPDFPTVMTEETVEEKKHLDLKYSVEPKEKAPPGEESDVEIVIVVPKVHKEVVSTEIKVEEGRRIPGAQGDTLKVVQNLPGVARASFGSGALIVWGSSPQDTRVYVDGVRVPLLYHMGGLRSTINSDMVHSIELAPGGYGADYGRGLGGLVTVTTRAPKDDGFHGYVAADVIDASAMVETPIDSKTRIALAGRKSYLDRLFPLVTKKDVADFVPIPDFFDLQGKIVRDLGQNESIEIFALGSRDNLVRSVPSLDPGNVKSESDLASYWRTIVKYQRDFSDGTSMYLTPSIGGDRARTIQSFGGSPTLLDIRSMDYGFRGGWRGKVHPMVTVSAGVDVEVTTSSIDRAGSVTAPAREGDIRVFGQTPPDRQNADSWTTVLASLAPFAQLDIAPFGDKLHVIVGGRLEPYISGGSRLTPLQGDTPSIGFLHESTAVEPRISIRYEINKVVSVKAAFGIYHQLPQPEDLSAVFGNPSLGISKATHWLAGGTFRVAEGLSIEAVGFTSLMSDLTSRSEAPTPPLAQGLTQDGIGRAFGGQVLIRKELTKGFFGWASYSLIRSERRDHPDTAWRLFDFDQTHVATVVASYEIGHGLEVGARFRYATGFPRTPVISPSSDLQRDISEPHFGAQNSIRIPAFWQFDIRVAKRFDFKRVKGELYLDVQNVTNNKNDEDIAYDYSYSNKAYITGLPILPVIGARIEW